MDDNLKKYEMKICLSMIFGFIAGLLVGYIVITKAIHKKYDADARVLEVAVREFMQGNK